MNIVFILEPYINNNQIVGFSRKSKLLNVAVVKKAATVLMINCIDALSTNELSDEDSVVLEVCIFMLSVHIYIILLK